MHAKQIITAGVPISKAGRALVMVHGRGGSAEDILTLSGHLQVSDFALLAPQATNQTWYPHSFIADPQQNEPWLSSAQQLLADIVEDLIVQGVSSDRIFFLGFSQGSCLTLEFVTRNAGRYGGVVAFSGGLIGDKIYEENYGGDFQQTPIFIGASDPDLHVPVERINATSDILRKMNADLTLKIYQNMGHTISQDEIETANDLIFSR
jgi:phospholipase/carboxylesterase